MATSELSDKDEDEDESERLRLFDDAVSFRFVAAGRALAGEGFASFRAPCFFPDADETDADADADDVRGVRPCM